MKHPRFSDFIARYFDVPIRKIPVDAGFTCPNRDGTIGNRGCKFCNNEGFTPKYCASTTKSIVQQLREGKAFFSDKHKAQHAHLAYFQSFSNTYADIEILQEKYEAALGEEGVEGLVIGTRPDCVNDEILDYLESLSRAHFVMLEYGVESVYDSALQRTGRGHDFEDSCVAIRKTAERNIPVGIHLILGLPGVTREDDVLQAEVLNRLPIDLIKLHQLQIMSNTAFAERFVNHPDEFDLYTLDEYIATVARFLDILREDIAVDRLVSEIPSELLIAPKWGLKPMVIERMISQYINKNNYA